MVLAYSNLSLAKENFEQFGFIVVENFLTSTECQWLMNYNRQLLTGADFKYKVAFDPKSQSHAQDQYFLQSANKIHFFFEKDAFDQNGQLVVAPEKAINKIGHALHKADTPYKALLEQQKFKQQLAALSLTEHRPLQSMVLCKQPKIGDAVAWHQDNSYLYTEPQSCVGFWLALEDATINNGCLWALPGQHRSPLRNRFRRNTQGFEYQILNQEPFDESDALALEVKAGTLICLDGNLPHKSNYNHSDSSRMAFTCHYVSASANYLADNWLQEDLV